jgi:hypothetical protein
MHRNYLLSRPECGLGIVRQLATRQDWPRPTSPFRAGDQNRCVGEVSKRGGRQRWNGEFKGALRREPLDLPRTDKRETFILRRVSS